MGTDVGAVRHRWGQSGSFWMNLGDISLFSCESCCSLSRGEDSLGVVKLKS